MADEKIIKVNGLNVNYFEDGITNQRSLLLIHGGLGDARLHWETAIPMLADDFHVIAPDLPGFGKTQSLPKMHTQDVVNWMKSFLEHLEIDEAVVIGNSHGGLLARLFAAANPAYVPALILVNGGGVPDMPSAIRFLERIPGVSGVIFSLLGSIGTSPDTIKRMFYNTELLTDDFLKQIRAQKSSFSRLMRMLISSPMPTAQSPMVSTLILWGVNDQIATLKDAEAIKSSIPGAVLTEITECGHMPQMETTDVFVWQIDTFLQKLSRPAKSESRGAGALPTLPS